MRCDDLVSIVVPFYNRAHLVPRVIGSLCAQTYRNLEILIVDDCSDDNLAEAVRTLGDDRVRIVRRMRNGGVAAARNTGVAEARGSLIAFHDSDDYCTVDRIDLSIRALRALPDDYVGVYGMRLFYNDVTVGSYDKIKTHVRPFSSERPLEGDLSERTVENNILNFPTILMKAAALRAAGPSDELLKKNVDWDLSLRLTKQGKFGFIPEPLILTPTSLDPSVSSARVSRSVRQGARSFVRICGKIRREHGAIPALASHYSTAGRYLMRLGRPLLARRFFAASLRINRAQPKVWAHYALSHAPGLHARMRRGNKL